MSYHLFITLPLYIFLHVGLFGVFRKAGEAGWKAFVPGYNVYTWLELVGRPKWWLIWFFIPVVNFIMGIGIILDLVRSFDKTRFRDQALAVLVPFGYFIYLGFNKQDTYIGKWVEIAETRERTKGQVREWLDAILFAGTAALIIRTFMIEAFMIPTTSMEGSLLAGDFLFVSKFHYGVRLPQAPLSFPFVHNTLPFTSSVKSYLPWPILPYSRLPALKSVKRNEIVVFNYPDDDRNPDVPDLGPIQVTSMKQNYIKRCVAVPGDSLEIRDRVLHINGEPAWEAEGLQFSYMIRGIGATPKALQEEFGFRNNPNDQNNNVRYTMAGRALDAQMSTTKLKEIQKAHPDWEIRPNIRERGNIKTDPNFKDYAQDQVNRIFFPDRWRNNLRMMGSMEDPRYPAKNAMFPRRPDKHIWTIDNFGPIYIPKAGVTVKVDKQSIVFYEKIIDVYENHDLDTTGGVIKIDGQVATEYTFEMDYFWMMGDNRHSSLDSRFWGYVPEDHIIGRPWFVLFSWEGGPRWDRFFRPVSKWEP